ncbi:hypothetical protein ACEWPM_005055 [Roseovarius sp. S4756]|uniref:hypothetical protein n=1 Tax=Roseovarius maritimus TaxID=3342637 RepID=UPI0037291FBB
MRERDWPELPSLGGDIIARDDLRVTCAPMPAAMLISGDLKAAVAAVSPDAPMLGLGGQTGGGAWAGRIARDRALLVSDAPITAASGWHADGYAMTPADDLWQVFTLTGPAAARVIAEGTAADIEAGSPSAAVLFAGQTCLLLRRGEATLICAETSRAWAMAEWLDGAGI